MVWAMILQPHKIYELQVKNTFRLTMANLDITSVDDKPVQIMFISEETKYLLCTLHKNNVWQVPLNLIIEKGANIAFVCHGGSYVHLLGHLKEYEILKEPEQDWRRDIAELLHNKTEELISSRNRIILNTEEIEYLEADESVNRNRKQLDISNASMPSTSKDQEDKKQSKRKANPPKDAEIKRMKSSSKSKENYDNEYDKDCEDMKSCNDSDDDNDDNNDNDDDTDTDNDNKTIESENEDSNEIEMEQEEKFMKSHKQEKKGKQQRKQDKQTKEETKREQKDKKKKKKKQGNNEGIRVIEGGVQVQELKAGTGKIAEPGKFVTIYYLARVQLEDCEPKVDKVLKGIGFRFKLGTGVTLRGVDVGIVGMKVGEKRRLFIPYKMGYGSAGCGPKIPPYSTLIYDVELIKVE